MIHPLLYEINTRCWLRELTQTHGGPISLATIPEAQFAEWQSLGFTHIWLMGVWTSGPRSRDKALQNDGLRRAYSEALPGWTEQDVGASPYAVAAYQVDEKLGGNIGLAEFRRRLNSCGLKLVLDFVPNHLGLDHPWLREKPNLFVHAPAPGPESYEQQTAAGPVFLAHGKDPYSPAWTDTVQLDYRRPETREAMSDLLQDVAQMCDGVRCDMAMLLLNEVFERTWGKATQAGSASKTEFWGDAIAVVRQQHPGFLFLAEVYWGIEDRLQALGFDYTYDKTLYDLLVARAAAAVQRHVLSLPLTRLAASAHFLENHDEPRIASLLNLDEHRAAAAVTFGLPGMRLLHEGQLTGLHRRLPVQLLRRLPEPPVPEIRDMYQRLLGALPSSAVGRGKPELLPPRKAWPDNPTDQNFVLVQWTAGPPSFDLVAVNLAPHRGQCFAPVNLPAPTPRSWALTDLLGIERFVRDSEDLRQRGLYLDLGPHAAQILHFEPQG